MTHVVEGQLKDAQEETNKEKALKLVIEASLKEKILRLNDMERQATTAEKALELAKQMASKAQGKLGETELKLAETLSIFSARDKEFTDYKGGEKARKQTYYNRGFRDTENLAGPVIFQA